MLNGQTHTHYTAPPFGPLVWVLAQVQVPLQTVPQVQERVGQPALHHCRPAAVNYFGVAVRAPLGDLPLYCQFGYLVVSYHQLPGPT